MTRTEPHRRLRKVIAGVIVFVLLGAIVVTGAVSLWSVAVHEYLSYRTIYDEELVSRSKESGNAIVKAIQAYHLDRGMYPTSLDSLVTDYLTSIPNPVAGTDEWRYRTTANYSGFSLCFGAGRDRYPGYYFDSENPGQWKSDF